MSFLSYSQNAFLKWREGLLAASPVAWLGACDDEPLRRTGWQGFWKERSYLFGDEFRRYIENDLMIRPPHPDAKPMGAFTIGQPAE